MAIDLIFNRIIMFGFFFHLLPVFHVNLDFILIPPLLFCVEKNFFSVCAYVVCSSLHVHVEASG